MAPGLDQAGEFRASVDVTSMKPERATWSLFSHMNPRGQVAIGEKREHRPGFSTSPKINLPNEPCASSEAPRNRGLSPVHSDEKILSLRQVTLRTSGRFLQGTFYVLRASVRHTEGSNTSIGRFGR
jgi:hypothetical protein